MRLRAFEEFVQNCFWDPVSLPAACAGQDGFTDFGAVCFWFYGIRVAEFSLGSRQQQAVLALIYLSASDTMF